MKDDQEQIFYATGESRQLLERSPHLEAFKAKGFEVLLLTDPVDEVWVESVPEFDGKSLQSVAKGEVDLGATGDSVESADQGDFAELLTWLTETLAEHVKEVRLSTRLTSSPACLITDTFGITPQLARMYRASGQEVPVGKRILELNPDHALITGLRQALTDSPTSDALAETAELLYGTALLAEGGVLDDPARFAALLTDRLARTV
jgi:molecular chaperone HtpG